MSAPKERYEQLAEAVVAIARADHYLVGLTDGALKICSSDDFERATQALIEHQNYLTVAGSPEHALYELALDLIEVYNNSRALRASC